MYPLRRRAWILEDRFPSGRILHVTAAELTSEYEAILCRECGAIFREAGYPAGNLDPRLMASQG
ncbi:hypothetical protein F5Y10DRAFT_258058 [Nemania abortiva]|nr:hypothetical protein F5Y10DRAFT_258058 [Nemania abortiva]